MELVAYDEQIEQTHPFFLGETQTRFDLEGKQIDENNLSISANILIFRAQPRLDIWRPLLCS